MNELVKAIDIGIESFDHVKNLMVNLIGDQRDQDKRITKLEEQVLDLQQQLQSPSTQTQQQEHVPSRRRRSLESKDAVRPSPSKKQKVPWTTKSQQEHVPSRRRRSLESEDAVRPSPSKKQKVPWTTKSQQEPLMTKSQQQKLKRSKK